MIEIIPAIMPISFSDLEEKIFKVKGLVSLVQIDVMDGKLTTDATWPYLEEGLDSTFQNILDEKQSMPLWDEIDFEVDLMVEGDLLKYTHDWIHAGAKRIILHYKSDPHIGETIQKIRANSVGKESPFYVEIGLGIEAPENLEEIKKIIPHVDFVQCMGIKEIGVQGSPFNSDILKTITSLRERFPELIISVDGGVNFETAPLLIKAGANRLVSGSAIYGSDNVKETISHLRSFV